MVNWFKRKKKDPMKQSGRNSATEASALAGSDIESSDREVETQLIFHPSTPANDEERYYFQFLNNELPPLKANQLSLAGIELKEDNQHLHVQVFVRNSLPKGVKIEQADLVLQGPDGEQLASQSFDFSRLGELQPESSMPWVFTFRPESVTAAEIPATDWMLSFQLKHPHKLELDPSWEQSIAETDREQLEQLVKSLQAPKAGEVNFMGISANYAKDGSLHTAVLLRNGSDRKLELRQLPLAVEDAVGDMVASGGFKFDALEVNPNTSKPWTFVFPAEMVEKKDADFSRWRAYPLKQK
ncbi:accessory Sec system S-layer assembly protein [Jeotgalibacillus malaysiensis]|uniref:accessory Sec system S-layer assembly protein n=1 Tax=Jeotgalibacillus malaysiensis TaxID=1508404 RepID=UPI00385182D5